MRLLFPLFFALFLTKTFSIREVHQGVVDEAKHPSVRMPLYHAHGKNTHHSLITKSDQLSFSDILALDKARIKYLNSKLTKKNSTSPSSRSSIDESFVNSPVNPTRPLGSYYTKVGLGTPSTDYLVVVDTGSSLSWVQCQPCNGYCYPQDGPPFDPSASTTYQRFSCDASQCMKLLTAACNSNVCLYKVLYGDRSTTEGYLSQDSLTFGSESFPGFVFGCGQYNVGKFGRQGGLFGLGRNDLSMLYQLTAGRGNNVIFSYCLPTPTGGGGFLSIGSSTSSGYRFTSMLTISEAPDLYSLELSSVSVSGQPINVPGPTSYRTNPMIIDSGTTLSYLPSSVYSALRDELVKAISPTYQMVESGSFSTCFMGSVDEISRVLPPVQLKFDGGAELNLSPRNVIINIGGNTACLSFETAGGDGGVAIIGNQQQQTFDIVYDVDGSRIGFAAGGCS